MNDHVITVEGLSKQYRLGDSGSRFRYKSFRDVLSNTFSAPLRLFNRQPKSQSNGDNSFWALKDVSFEVNRGEVIGIIGRNGAGKSTLLKILSRITEPTTGEVDIVGRVGSLLEVGTGFHPELTGRENIYLNGAILGMKRGEISRKFDEIVAFAETEKFLDTQVKYYSSGMYTRLAFAVAAHLEPEILIVDEVLAVGDAQFQRKCLGRMTEVARHGRTVLFVSHNMTAVNSLCTRAILLSAGKVEMNGPTSDVVSAYLQSGSRIQTQRLWEDPAKAPGNEQAKLRSVRVSAANADSGQILTVEDAIRMDFEYWNYVEGARLNLSIVLYTIEGILIFNTVSTPQNLPAGLIKSSFEIPGSYLNDGAHRVRVMIVRDEGTQLLDMDDVVQFEVSDVQREVAWHGKWAGVVRPKFQWSTERSAPV
jgi:lipopolysaccharide transport system ATP-binding protein